MNAHIKFEKLNAICDIYDLTHCTSAYFWIEDAEGETPTIVTRQDMFSKTLNSLNDIINSKYVYTAIEKEIIETETQKAMKIFDALGVSRQNEYGTYKTPLKMFKEGADKLSELIEDYAAHCNEE